MYVIAIVREYYLLSPAPYERYEASLGGFTSEKSSLSLYLLEYAPGHMRLPEDDL